MSEESRDLVERLRGEPAIQQRGLGILLEAASRIEELERERDQAREALRYVEEFLGTLIFDDTATEDRAANAMHAIRAAIGEDKP